MSEPIDTGSMLSTTVKLWLPGDPGPDQGTTAALVIKPPEAQGFLPLGTISEDEIQMNQQAAVDTNSWCDDVNWSAWGSANLYFASEDKSPIPV